MAVFKVFVSIIEPSFFRTNLMQTEAMVKSFENTFRNLPQSVKDEYGQEYFDAGIQHRPACLVKCYSASTIILFKIRRL